MAIARHLRNSDQYGESGINSVFSQDIGMLNPGRSRYGLLFQIENGL